ncbi:hypothetical protein AB6887_02120 [Carnobacterium divergens]|uniref:LXG domain-containing protein n=1 Tax=Carnobacterium divergens TaxID=2748 RepID=A0A7Z8G4K7_CARDV|nr:hypothetical protein [Carnobacterium divergens]TFI73625.1 hypothetical protein CKN58_06540 [Carnobacterium divergens]TFI77572.1 hypothetical protein CKN85_06535 [Carnobacterium divergens]TFI84335.1 hypothetical protein CKN56_06575 [Carnobacterium divergens]TFI96182.1 hypothetical protein CKN64_06515 [Carnobacterium divergens]TFJ12485.1 hypothetical protein CKN60_06580 [Carnobacterium divergens]
MPRIDYQELKGLSDELTSLRQSIVSYLKEYNRANDHFVEENELQGQAWSSAKSYHRNYKTISDSIFNALYDLDDTLKAYLATFKSLVGEAENRLDTDELQDLQNQLRQLQTQKLDFMEEMAKVFKDVPVLKEFFGQQSMYGKMKEIELLKRYEQFEKQTQGNFDNVHETLRAILQGLAYLGDSKNFESGANGYHALNLNSLEWYQKLESYNSNHKEDCYEIKEIKTKYGTFYQFMKNGKVQKEATEALQKSKLMESVDMMAQLTPEILKILMGIDDIEVLMDDGSTKVQKAGASFWLLLSVLPPDKIKDIIKSAKLAKKAGKGLDGIHLTEKEWKNFKALDKTKTMNKMSSKIKITAPLTKNNKSHIHKHNIDSLKNQSKYLDDIQLTEKLDATSFFNDKWTTDDINKYTEIAYNDLLSQGKKGNTFPYQINGETLSIYINADGGFGTAYGTYQYTLEQFKNLVK